MTGNLNRGAELYNVHHHQFAPFAAGVVLVYDEQDLMDIMTYIESIVTIPIQPEVYQQIYALRTDRYCLINLLSEGQPLYLAWEPFIATREPGYDLSLLMARLADSITGAAVGAAKAAGYDPQDGSVMFQNLVSAAMYSMIKIISKHLNGALCCITEPCMYLQQNLHPSTLSTMHWLSATQIDSMARDEFMRTENASITYDRHGWYATTYFY